MSPNIIAVPQELYRNDLPSGFDCSLFVGQMVGRLGPHPGSQTLKEFNYQIPDPQDTTEVLLRDVTFESPAAELAKWENAGDTVGIVMAYKGERADMVLAYNFTRRKWFGTGYYPHVRDYGIATRMTVGDISKYASLCLPAILLCGLGCLGIPVLMVIGMQKTAQYRKLNPTDFRGATAQRIAQWIAKNESQILPRRAGISEVDPSL